MGRLFRIILACVVALVLWAGIVGFGARAGWWRQSVAASGDAAGFMRWAEDRYRSQSRGNIAITLLEDGAVAQTFFASPDRPVDADSLFQAASLSKWLTASGVMTLVDEGRIDLDAPVSRYLSRWRLPESAFDNDQVTVRRLLSHTAGLSDDLGFSGYAPDAALPSIEAELTHTSDVLDGADGVVRVGARPGSAWRYSGGGYLILQLVIEEVTRQPFNDYMREAVFTPLGMSASTFVDPDPARVVDFYAPDGSRAVHYRFTATGAASLYTSTADLTRFLQAHLSEADGPPGRGVLTPATLEAMRAPEAALYGLPVWGLGPSLYAPHGAGFVIGHDGSNYPAVNTTARINPETGDGIIVLSTGNATLAREIGGEWLYWKTGTVGLDTIIVFDLRGIVIVFASGALVILVAGTFFARRRRTQQV